MSNNIETVIEREKSIREKVNIIEQLHKTCQLSAIGLSEAVLNESRYLSRALADVLFFERNSEEHLRALEESEHAARNAINDSIDLLVTYVKVAIARFETRYQKFDVATSVFGTQYMDVLGALTQIDPKIVRSRKDRTERLPVYSELSNSDLLDKLTSFALNARQIEAFAKRVSLGVARFPEEAGAGDVWLANKIESALNGATTDARMEVYFQPKYSIKDGENVCVGAEALMRMKCGAFNPTPELFITVAEHNGLINEIGSKVLRESLQLLADLPALPAVSVNVSPYELLDPEYSNRVLALIAEVLPGQAHRLELEITEGTAIENGRSLDHIVRLSEEGVRIAIDDFGTGQTRFDYLAQFKIDTIKIDQSLIRQLRIDKAGYCPLIKAISAIGSVYGMDIVAEGVEFLDEINLLINDAKIEKFQGWYFEKALSKADFVSKVHCFS